MTLVPRPVEIDEASLKQIAEKTGGKYFRAVDKESLATIYRDIDALERTEVTEVKYLQYAEHFPYLVGAGLSLLALRHAPQRFPVPETAMNEFRFAEPGWIHLLWLIAAIAGALVFLEFRGRSVLERFVSRIMQPRLVRRPTLLRRDVGIEADHVGDARARVCLMRPQWGMTVQRAVRVDSQIMICLDVSKSMLAEDVAPNRLEAPRSNSILYWG